MREGGVGLAQEYQEQINESWYFLQASNQSFAYVHTQNHRHRQGNLKALTAIDQQEALEQMQHQKQNKENKINEPPISCQEETRKRTRRRGLREGKRKDERNDATTREDQSLSEFDDFTNAMSAMKETRTGGEVLQKNKKVWQNKVNLQRRQRRRERRNQTATSTQRNWARIHRTNPTTNVNYQREHRATHTRKHTVLVINIQKQKQVIKQTLTGRVSHNECNAHVHLYYAGKQPIKTEPPRQIETNREHPKMTRRRWNRIRLGGRKEIGIR